MRKVAGTLPAYVIYASVVACLLATMMISVACYRSSVKLVDEASSGRTAVRYVGTKLTQHDESGCVHVQDMDGTSVLVLDENDGKTCRLYWYNGSLRESYSWSDEPFNPESGIPVIDVEQVAFAYDNILSMSIDGNVSYFQVKSGGESHE